MIPLYLKLGLTTDQIRVLLRGEVASPDAYEYCEEMLSFYEAKLNNVDSQIAHCMN
ncbi:transcriptional regulator, MerR family protein [Paenibacillus vortex V453]|jgi:MerR family Zn(II)-responsive transcriptional regulator of zntA|uniref:Transcriptional regulator, MerR family protein n=1 Tax=Paenibacillus vortex V453 TaxID=715225 RepID=A0A2R9SQT7_9BACL|nr:transcriptional regulator, MerR family protein [Paenibacillus vortex V453]ETT42834.1 MerR family transcriptional regulator [Paenibacillus sp. FSL R5-808]